MIQRIRAARADERGYSLVELLVVVVILGALAAIAIPTLVQQRESAASAAAQSDLRNAAVIQEAIFEDEETYADDLDTLKANEFRPSADITFVVEEADDSGYCMSAEHDAGSETWYYGSDEGAPSTTDCSP